MSSSSSQMSSMPTSPVAIPCIICRQIIGVADHRMCFLNGLSTGRFIHSDDWMEQSKTAHNAATAQITHQ